MSDTLGDTLRSVWDKLTFNDPAVLRAKKEYAEEEERKRLALAAPKKETGVKDRDKYIDKKVKEAGG
jgi:hypothetical protein